MSATGRLSFKPRRPLRAAAAKATHLLWLLPLGWAAGLAWFAATLPAFKAVPPGMHVEGIVVLTGSPGRIRTGVDALKAGIGDRLLISGVNPELAGDVIRSALPADARLQACCIDLGRAARDTEGNAAEAVRWAQAHGFDSLAVVTSDWHMRRSLLEFDRLDHDLSIYPVPVQGEAGWPHLAKEYSKYLIARARAWL